MQIHGLTKSYETKTDEELLQLASSSEQLTLEAHSALTSELARRRIDVAECLEAHIEEDEKARAGRLSLAPPTPGESENLWRKCSVFIVTSSGFSLSSSLLPLWWDTSQSASVLMR